MKKLAGLLLLTLVARPVLAVEPQPPQEIHAPGLGFSAETVERLEKTVHKMNMDPSEPMSYCTAFPVSPDGYVLTALHCVRSCLVEHGAVEEASNEYLGIKDLVVVKNPGQTGVTCENFTIPGLGVQRNVKVLATGSSLLLYDSGFLADSFGLFRQLADRGRDRKANDYALLKIETSKSLDCLRLSPKRPVGGQEVWSVGFPVSSVKGAPPVLSASRGQRFSHVEDSVTYQSQPTDADRAWIRRQFGAPGLIFASAMNNFGQSGGPIVDAHGDVVGITSGFSVPVGKNLNNIHELTGPNTASVLVGLPRELARDLLRKNAACSP